MEGTPGLEIVLGFLRRDWGSGTNSQNQAQRCIMLAINTSHKTIAQRLVVLDYANRFNCFGHDASLWVAKRPCSTTIIQQPEYQLGEYAETYIHLPAMVQFFASATTASS